MKKDDETFNLAIRQSDYDHTDNVPMCQEPHCDSSAITCTIDDETNEYYCPEHAAENGYCCCCGIFIAGWRDFSDMCENCEIELSDDIDDEMEDGFYDDIY